jgi:hypothetical protein
MILQYFTPHSLPVCSSELSCLEQEWSVGKTPAAIRRLGATALGKSPTPFAEKHHDSARAVCELAA